jgi:hypothetical protein
MKGVVFTEFLEFIEDKFGFDVSDKMIEDSSLSTDGIFTQAGNYPFDDLFNMIVNLSKITKVEVSDLVKAYGIHLFSKLITIYPKPTQDYNNTFDFIRNVEDVVHPEVKKLYPDSDLPHFEDVKVNENELTFTYVSNKPLMDFAVGLIEGCAEYYNEKVEVSYKLIKNTNFRADFLIRKV